MCGTVRLRQNVFEKQAMNMRQVHSGERKSLLCQRQIDSVCYSIRLNGPIRFGFLSNPLLPIILIKPLSDFLARNLAIDICLSLIRHRYTILLTINLKD